jgi:hypothetical protein
LLGEGAVHVQPAELQKPRVREARFQGLLTPPQKERHELGEAVLANVLPAARSPELVQQRRGPAAQAAAELHDLKRSRRH